MGEKYLYFGRPIHIYGTEKDSFLMRCIRGELRNFTLEDPSAKEHQKGYALYKEKTGRGMNYFLRQVLPRMDAGVFMAFPDGMFGTGVFDEAKFLRDSDKPILEIHDDGLILILTKLDETRKLSVEETQKRLRELMPKKA